MANDTPWVLGLTGGIGSGKSTASKRFGELGIDIVDADKVARQVVEPGTQGLTKIAARYGDDILTAEKELDRAKLRAIIFSNIEEKAWLNALLHPMIRTEMLAQLNKAQSDYVILEAPLLFENNLDKYCSRTLLIDLPFELQIARASARDGAKRSQIRTIIESQLNRTEKVRKSDDIISNTSSISELRNKVWRYHQCYLRLASLQSS
ncbi:dephospho-CoA kinase [Pseudoalteromonas sp. YIC-656]|uniref:dephospho-CoA kinase n=1 Tax=Pseudoalteromonas pernae TaxID=3118054 RepID=UPI003242997E